jgi:transposase-like protein
MAPKAHHKIFDEVSQATFQEALQERLRSSPSTVSRVFHSLETEFEGWRTRKLKAHYLYLYADGAYFTVIYNEEGCKMPILAIVGIDETGQREVLAFCVGEREHQKAWEEQLEDLKGRGIKQVDLWVTDGNQAMLNAIQNNFPKQHWKYLRTTNIIERLFNEVKRRSHKMAAAFRNENSCLLMFYTVTRSLKLRKITIPAREIEPQILLNP